MQNKIISLTKKFVAIKSIDGNKKELDEILKLAVSQLKEYTIEHFKKNGIKSTLVYNTKTRPKKFKIILNVHLDVIPGKENQYKAKVKENKLFGVGAMDMKANAACMIYVFKKIAKELDYPIALQLTTDEETGGFNGTQHQIKEGVRGDFVITSEPTNFDIVYQAKGILWLKVYAKGITAHGAYPWRGENAVLKIHKFVTDLQKKYPNPKNEKWVTTINVSKIETKNIVFNKIPDDCEVWLDIRYIPKDSKTIVQNIKKLLPKECKMEIIEKEPSLMTDKNDFYIKKLKNITTKVIGKKTILRGAQGSSDARHYANINCPGIEFGPIGGGIGSDAEWVDIPSLEKYCEIITSFLKKI